MVRNKIFLFCLLICFQEVIFAQIPVPIKQLLQSSYMQGASFSLLVKDVESGEVVYSYDMERQLSPASVLKTVTTATALEILGEDYCYPTSLEYSGVVKDGVLEGNLYIKGSGDPSLGSSHFAPEQMVFLDIWVTALQEAGIKKIAGAIVSDESIFDAEGLSLKWLREDMGNYYAAGSYGISVFDNLYKLFLQTGAIGTQPTIVNVKPDVPCLQFKNYLKSASVSSDSAYIIGSPFDSVRYLYGVLPANREQYILRGDIPDPALFLAQYLTSVLQQKGIEVEGFPSCVRIEKERDLWKLEERQTLVTTYSPPLKEIVSVCNHVSHNLFADALLKTIGLQYEPSKNEVVSSFGRGIKVLKDYWKKKGIDISSLIIYDGSGLAPMDKVSAKCMGELLVYMATKSSVSSAFVTSLPQAGVEGTVGNFLKGTALQGKVCLKSGGMTGVRCYAGYVTQHGKKYAVVIFSNNYTCSMRQMTKGIEKLLLQLFN